jgi:hypothetical protein
VKFKILKFALYQLLEFGLDIAVYVKTMVQCLVKMQFVGLEFTLKNVNSIKFVVETISNGHKSLSQNSKKILDSQKK